MREKKKLTCFLLNPDQNQLNPDHNNSCNSTIARLERVDVDELFVSPLTLQSFTCEFFLVSIRKAAGENDFFFLTQPSSLISCHL